MFASIKQRVFSRIAIPLLVLTISCSISHAGLPELVTRQEIFANPVKKDPLISPDGAKLAYLAPDDGVMNVYVKTIGSDDDCCVTADSSRGIRRYAWSGDSRSILYLQDRLGNENWHLYSCRIDGPGRKTIDLTPFDDVRVAEFFVSPGVFDHVVVSMNKDNPQSSDLYAVDLTSGRVNPLVGPPGMVREYIVGPDLSVRGCIVIDEDGLNYLLSYSPSTGEWKSLRTWGYEDNLTVYRAGAENDVWYLAHTLKGNFESLYRLNVNTREETLVFSPSRADVSSVLFLNNLEEPVAVAEQYLRMEWTALSEAVKRDLDVIEGGLPGDFVVENISPDDNVWLIKHIEDDRPDTYYKYDRGIGKLEFLFSSNPSLEQYEFAQVIPVIIKANDGLELPCYTVIPPGVKAERLPLVVVIHGGPWSRESWEFEPTYQLLANRGYALLIVNFRGSTGFGKEFLNAGDNEWAKRMQTDVYDAVEWAIDTGLADPERIGVVGGSYGGYSVLWSMIQRPDLFRCGVSVCGPSRLLTLVECFPAYHKPLLQWVKTKVGDWDQSPEMLDAISPIFEVDKIRAPMLIVQGANDPRVKVEESLRIVRAMRDNSQPVTYVEFPDEGHGLQKPENEMAFNALLEAFLARNLGGRFQPATGEEEELLNRYSRVYE
jgi:dipeptidyl aminopeptidase/acylaminoacyl peptidase